VPANNPEDNRAQQRQWYYRNRKKKIALTRKRHREVTQRASDIRETSGCVFCGEKDPSKLVFHHTRPKNKTASINTLIRRGVSWKVILEEIRKCIVLCKKCHIIG
jgi:hypothetical protein